MPNHRKGTESFSGNAPRSTGDRTAMFQTAFCSLSNDPENAADYALLRHGDGKGRRCRTHKKAMVDVMRKQLRRLVAALIFNQPFVKNTPAAA